MGENNVQSIFPVLNDLAKLISAETNRSSQHKIKGANGLRTFRYSPYEIDNETNKLKRKSRKKAGKKKIKMKCTGINAEESSLGQTYSNFLFLDDMFTMSTKEVCEIARNGHGYKLILSNSQESLKSDGAIEEQSRISVSKAPGTYWIKYS